MRVAALYDVHGNLPALEAVLADVDAAEVDLIVSGGDVVWGPVPAECLERLAGRDARYLMGNADREVLKGEDERHAWCRAQLGARQLAAVERWPATVELEIEGLGHVLCCHGSPRSEHEMITEATTDELLAEIVDDIEAEVVVCGHTHHQFDRRIGRTRVVNAGSVGLPYEGKRAAFWLLLGPDVEHRRTEYDVESAVDALVATGFPGAAEFYEPSLSEPMPKAEVVAYFESQRGA